MGTNFYTLRGNVHVGLRYAAGYWCFDCKQEALVLLATTQNFADPHRPTREEIDAAVLAAATRTISKAQFGNLLHAYGWKSGPPVPVFLGWTCPQCGRQYLKSAQEDDLFSVGPAARELGFDTRPYVDLPDPTGLAQASGFIWQVRPEHDAGVRLGLAPTIEGVKRVLKRRTAVKDEYGRVVPINEFWAMFKTIGPEQESDYDFS